MPGSNRPELEYPKIHAYPYSLDPLPSSARHGLIAIAFFAIVSFLATFGLLSFLTYRIIRWKKFYTTYIGFNQYLVLLYMLLLADTVQILSFLFSFHWLRKDAIIAPTAACNAQGWLMQATSVAMAMWVFAIALHSWLAVWRGRHFNFIGFVVAVTAGWLLVLLLTVSGPAQHHHNDYWVRTAAWCWISDKYHSARVSLSVVWITAFQIGQFALFLSIMCFGRRRTNSGLGFDNSSAVVSANRLSSIMSWYAMVYILFQIPLQSNALAGASTHFTYYGFAGSAACLTGLAHTVLYIYTREDILTSTFDIPASSPRSRGFSDGGSDNVDNPKRGPVTPWGGPDGNFSFPAKPTRTFSVGKDNRDGLTHGTPQELTNIEIVANSKRAAKHSSREIIVEQSENDWARPHSQDLHSQKPAQVWHAI